MLKCVYRKKDCVSLLVHICCVYTHTYIYVGAGGGPVGLHTK